MHEGSPETAAFGLLASAAGFGSIFPQADAEDLSRGARYIPEAVTDARRAGAEVSYHADESPYWQLPDDTRIYE